MVGDQRLEQRTRKVQLPGSLTGDAEARDRLDARRIAVQDALESASRLRDRAAEEVDGAELLPERQMIGPQPDRVGDGSLCADQIAAGAQERCGDGSEPGVTWGELGGATYALLALEQPPSIELEARESHPEHVLPGIRGEHETQKPAGPTEIVSSNRGARPFQYGLAHGRSVTAGAWDPEGGS